MREDAFFPTELTLPVSGLPNDIHVDVRVIAATNRRLEDQVQEGSSERTYYRLNGAAHRDAAAPRSRPRCDRAALLGLHRDQIRYRMEKYGVMK